MNRPYLRPAPPEGAPSAPAPPGCEATPVGLWGGKPCEVVCDPRHFDIALMRPPPEAVARGMEAGGWRRAGADGERELWTRDRRALARSRLDATAAARPAVLRIR